MSEQGHRGYIRNDHVKDLNPDILFHLKLSTGDGDMKERFGGIKFVCVGGSPVRMKANAQYLKEQLTDFLSDEERESDLVNITGEVDRYVVYKVGPVLVASHGIGVPSMSILLHEIFKLLHHAGATGVQIVRLGTSGGLGVEPGTLVVTSQAVNPEGRPVFEQYICGKKSERATDLNTELSQALMSCKEAADKFEIISGKTMSADDFYEAQGRIDGAICNYTHADKMEFMKRLHDQGVKNIEMECVGFAALTKEIGIPSAVMCVTLVNRLIDDQVKSSHEQLKEIEQRPIRVFSRHVRRLLRGA